MNTKITLNPENLTCYVVDEDLGIGWVKTWTTQSEAPKTILKQLQAWIDRDGSDYVTPTSAVLGITIKALLQDGWQDVVYFNGPGCVRKAAKWLETELA